MIRVLELGSLGAFAGSTVTASVMATPPNWVIQFGALGIVAFMVFQNYRQTRELMKLSAEQARAMNRISQCLEDRPCLQDDQRIKQKGG